MPYLKTNPKLEEQLRAALGRHLSPPIAFPFAAASAFDNLGLPKRTRNVPDGYVVRSEQPALKDLIHVRRDKSRTEVRVLRGRPGATSALAQHRASALELMENALAKSATLAGDEQALLIKAALQSASSAMNADARGLLPERGGYTHVRFVRGGAPELGKRR